MKRLGGDVQDVGREPDARVEGEEIMKINTMKMRMINYNDLSA